MQKPSIDDRVRLTQDIPERLLSRGQVGVVRSTWFAPSTAYEVEFENDEQPTRVLVCPEQMVVEEAAAMVHVAQA